MSGSNSKNNKSDKRVRIIDAAVSVFAQKGYHLSRVSDIAKVAGVADGTIYLYFRNKEDVLLSIFEEKMGILLAEMRKALQDTNDPLEKIRIYVHQHFIQLQKHPDIAKVLQVELRQSQQFINEYRPEKLWEYLEILGDTIREGQDLGVIRQDVDPFLLQWSLFGALDELAIQWVVARKRERFNLTQAANQVTEIFIYGLTTTIKTGE